MRFFYLALIFSFAQTVHGKELSFPNLIKKINDTCADTNAKSARIKVHKPESNKRQVVELDCEDVLFWGAKIGASRTPITYIETGVAYSFVETKVPIAFEGYQNITFGLNIDNTCNLEPHHMIQDGESVCIKLTGRLKSVKMINALIKMMAFGSYRLVIESPIGVHLIELPIALRPEYYYPVAKNDGPRFKWNYLRFQACKDAKETNGRLFTEKTYTCDIDVIGEMDGVERRLSLDAQSITYSVTPEKVVIVKVVNADDPQFSITAYLDPLGG